VYHFEEKMFNKASWIWADDNTKMNDWVFFRKDFYLEEKPSGAVIHIAAETKYYLLVNGELTIFDGGLFRESTPGCGYYDSVDIASRLCEGSNTLIFLVWRFGNGGRNNSDCGRGGLLYECTELGLYSGADDFCRREEAYRVASGVLTSYIIGGHDICYDAQSVCADIFSGDLNALAAAINVPATVYGGYGSPPWNRCAARDIPMFVFSDIIKASFKAEGGVYTVELPVAAQVTPYFEVEAAGGEPIEITYDRYITNGGPGYTELLLYGHKHQYICRPGRQRFEGLDWFFCRKIFFSIPDGIKVIALGYRESGYDCRITANVKSDMPILDRLIEKSAHTVKVCMRENFMDCPDRERGAWVGDASVEAPIAAYGISGAFPLLRKTAFDIVNLRRGEVIGCNVPGDCFIELPGHCLNAVGEYGAIAVYYDFTGDKSVLAPAYEAASDYLRLWNIGSDGLIETRPGDWYWFDHLHNIDNKVLENAWYYSALRFAERAGKIIGETKHADFINKRKETIEKNFESAFWKGDYFAGGSFVDDRANAMAVLSGLCRPKFYSKIRNVLLSVFNSTVYMEYYVLEALCQMGYKQDAFRRMTARFYNLATNDDCTLWEDFYLLGTRNHGWAGSPLTIIYKYFAGLSTADGFDTYKIVPDIAPLKRLECTFESRGKIKRIIIDENNNYKVV